MSAPSDSATSSPPCACTNISLMQLFHELKQKFPGVPDHVVSNTIELYCHDKKACETHLHREVKASLTHAYHASSSAAARQLNELKANPPVKCRNQPIQKHEIVKSEAAKSTTCQSPQKATIGTVDQLKDNVNTDDNQNIVLKTGESNILSPVTVNIDKCEAKYSADSPSDIELTNESKNTQVTEQEPVDFPNKIVRNLQEASLKEQQENTNYRIHKSNKITANLNEKLEFVKEKKTIKKEDIKPQEKPQRPNTLNFIKANPDGGFQEHLKQPSSESCRTVSPAPPQKETQDQKPGRQERDRGFPLNVSVNVNCHMDLSHGYDPWLEDYDSPRAITSVNLTVCTPTSNMASPVRETRDDDSGFEGHVTVTVSPSTARAPRRRAPPPPPQASRIESPRFTRAAPEPPEQTLDRSLIERQKERLSRLASALAQEKGRLAQLNQETQILAAPPPTPNMTQRLKDYVERLRDECDTLAKRLEMRGTVTEDVSNFYSNIYTGQRPPSSWQCHMCTFRNHPLLDKCEECDMPRILVGTSPATTHDSGFGSFRERNRRGVNNNSVGTDVTDSPLPSLSSDCRAVNV